MSIELPHYSTISTTRNGSKETLTNPPDNRISLYQPSSRSPTTPSFQLPLLERAILLSFLDWHGKTTRPLQLNACGEVIQRHTIQDDAAPILRPLILMIHSPFPTERMLYLTYLTAPVHSGSVATGGVDDMVSSAGNTDDGMEDDYAQLRVRINQKPAILIEAWHTAGTPNQELARTTAVGMLPPGTSTVQLDPVLHHDHQRTRPFQLLGWSLLPETVEGCLSLEYSLEESRVPVEDYWNWFSK